MQSEFAESQYLLPKGYPVAEIVNVRIEIIADPLKVLVDTASLDSLIIPVRYLDADKYANVDDN